MSKLTGRTPEEIVNDTLWENLRKIQDVPDEFDVDRLWELLEQRQRTSSGIRGRDDVVCVKLNEDVLEKVNIKCRLSNKTPDEVVNDVLWDCLSKLEDVSDEFDAEKIWNKLDHDKPEGDDILDRITDMFD